METFGAVAADVARVREHMESDDAAGLLLRFEDGQRGTCTISQVSAGRKNTIEWESTAPPLRWPGRRRTPSGCGPATEGGRTR